MNENQLLVSGYMRLTVNFPHLISSAGNMRAAERLSAILRRNRNDWIMQKQIAGKQSERRQAQVSEVFQPSPALFVSSPFAATSEQHFGGRSPLDAGSGCCDCCNCNTTRCPLAPAAFDNVSLPGSGILWTRTGLHDVPAHPGGVDSAAARSALLAGAWRWAWEDGELGPATTGGEWTWPVWMLAASASAERPLPDPFGPAPTHAVLATAPQSWWCGALADLPPAGDPAAGWATFDALLPEILREDAARRPAAL